MRHLWRDLHEDRVREIARDMQTANAGIQGTTATESPKRYIGRVWRWFISRRKPQTAVTIPANRLQQKTS